jgi:hypothetical protein
MFCGAQVCEPIIGNVLVYRDDDHITSTYIRTLTPLLEMVLVDRVPDLMTRDRGNTNTTAATGKHTEFTTLKLQKGAKKQATNATVAPSRVPSPRVSRAAPETPTLTLTSPTAQVPSNKRVGKPTGVPTPAAAQPTKLKAKSKPGA